MQLGDFTMINYTITSNMSADTFPNDFSLNASPDDSNRTYAFHFIREEGFTNSLTNVYVQNLNGVAIKNFQNSIVSTKI